MRNPSRQACPEFLDAFSDFIDHTLPPGREAEIVAHLDCCEACLRHLRTYRQGVTTLRENEPETDPIAFWDRLEHRLWQGGHLAPDRRREGAWAARPVTAVAAAAGFAVAIFFAGIWGTTVWPSASPGDSNPTSIVVVEGPAVAPSTSEALSTGASADDVDEEAGSVALASVAPIPQGRRGETSNPESRRAPGGSGATADRVGATSLVSAARVARQRLESERASALERAISELERRVSRPDWSAPSLTGEGWIRPVRLERAPIHTVNALGPTGPAVDGPWSVEAALVLP